MSPSDFAYELPQELIAQRPLAERAASRLLVVDDSSGALRDRGIRDLPAILRAGDLLVFNDTRVIPARLHGTKPSGGHVEIFLERTVAPCEALVQLRASKPIRPGLIVTTAGGPIRIMGRESDLWRAEFPTSVLDFLERWGAVPLPPYIARDADAVDRERYQSIFASERGAVAAPTASLHFDSTLVAELDARGVGHCFITLHVGAGTFQPVRTRDLDAHVMHSEYVRVGAESAAKIARAQADGGRIVAVGTTVVRALESAALVPRAPGEAWSADTRLFIRPGFRFRAVDALLTNFHLPESTLLMLVCAFGGQDAVLGAYRHAVAARYRFFSYGDAMFLTRSPRSSE